MAVTQNFVDGLASNFSFFLNVIQAVGLAIVAYILFNIVNVFFSRKREKELEEINKNLEKIQKILGAQSKKK